MIGTTWMNQTRLHRRKNLAKLRPSLIGTLTCHRYFIIAFCLLFLLSTEANIPLQLAGSGQVCDQLETPGSKAGHKPEITQPLGDVLA